MPSPQPPRPTVLPAFHPLRPWTSQSLCEGQEDSPGAARLGGQSEGGSLALGKSWLLCFSFFSVKREQFLVPVRIPGPHACRVRRHEWTVKKGVRQYILVSAPHFWHGAPEAFVISRVIEVSFVLVGHIWVGSWMVPTWGWSPGRLSHDQRLGISSPGLHSLEKGEGLKWS